jgi:PiT family inorganic phosphate transporter
VELWVGLALAFAFTLTNGFHDASNSIATLVATRAARPATAVALAGAFNMLGAVLVGTAVASTVAGIVTLGPRSTTEVVGSGLAGAVCWNIVTWWRGVPSSSGHALVGGLVGAALVDAGSDAVRWGGFDGWRPAGVTSVVVALAVSPMIGFAAGYLLLRTLRAALRRATRRVRSALVPGEWVMSALLSFAHGANDAQKAMGVAAALLLADGRIDELTVPLWLKVTSGAVLTLGTAMGGWRIARTVGSRIVRLHAVDALASQASSTAVILAASAVGAPVSSTHVVAASVVGTGGGRRRWHHVRWEVVRELGLAWLTTIPASAALGAVAVLVWREIG